MLPAVELLNLLSNGQYGEAESVDGPVMLQVTIPRLETRLQNACTFRLGGGAHPYAMALVCRSSDLFLRGRRSGLSSLEMPGFACRRREVIGYMRHVPYT